MYAKILKFNPYHDETGAFSSKNAAKFTSLFGKPKTTQQPLSGTDLLKLSKKLESKTFDEAIPKKHMDAAIDYRVNGFHGLNSGLRDGKSLSKDEVTRIRAIDAMVTDLGVSAGEDITLHRSVSDEELAYFHDNKTGVLHSFLSTTVSEAKAKSFKVGNNAVVIKVKRGTTGLMVMPNSSSEKEVVLARGKKFSTSKVGGTLVVTVQDTKTPLVKKEDMSQVDLSVAGKLNAQLGLRKKPVKKAEGDDDIVIRVVEDNQPASLVLKPGGQEFLLPAFDPMHGINPEYAKMLKGPYD